MKTRKDLLRGNIVTGRDVSKVILLLWTLIILGLFSLAAPAAVRALEGDWPGVFTVIGSGLFLAGAATLTGSVVGFLFGVPLREPRDGNAQEEARQGAANYRPNTNLEHISDWLTKIIVGIGLTQFPHIFDFVSTIGSRAAPAFGAAPSGEIIAISILVHYCLVGFFNGFLLAYLWLPGAFSRAVGNRAQDGGNDEVRTQQSAERL